MSAKYSKYQQDIIRRYYENTDTIALQNLGELVTELYLAKNSPKEDRLWERVEKAMNRLEVKPNIQEHIMQKRQVEILARNLEDWLKAAAQK